MRWLLVALPRDGMIGAAGIENNNERDLKDLRGMRRTTMSLKMNDGERKEILIAPLRLPGLFSWPCFPQSRGFNPPP